MGKVIVSAKPSDVREWAADNGYAVGTRGKMPADVIKEYNRAHGTKYRPGQYVATKPHTAKPAKGRAKTVKVNPAQVREAAMAAGVEVGKRGRISRDVLDAYVLGTL